MGGFRVESGKGLRVSVCGISTQKEVKLPGKILQYCCGNSFSFLKGSGREVRGSREGLSEGDTQ